MTKRLASVLSGLVLLAGILPVSARAQVRDVVFSGRITDPAVDVLIERLLASPGSRLVVTTAGGEEVAGVRLGDFIRRNRTELVIRGACLSACANSVLTASPKVEFEPGAVVAFHHSATSIVGSYQRMAEVVPTDLAEAARVQAEIYQTEGVDIELLNCAASRVGQMDRYIEKTEPGSTDTRRSFALRKRWWVPRQATLERLGVNVRQGRVNVDRQRVMHVLNSPVQEVVFGESTDCR